jgi:hypothetical protein
VSSTTPGAIVIGRQHRWKDRVPCECKDARAHTITVREKTTALLDKLAEEVARDVSGRIVGG